MPNSNEKIDTLHLALKALKNLNLPSDIIETIFFNIECAHTEEEAFNNLKNNKLLKWDVYLKHNRDVYDAGVDPVEHYFKNGIYEGRKLEFEKNMQSDSAEPDIPDISVIVPNYNGELFLMKCIDSLLTQSLSNIEVVVVDDGSDDNSLQILTKFNDPRIHLIKFEKNLSQHMGRKMGVELARGRYIMFLDSDDFYDKYACEKALEAISAGYDIVGFGTNIIDQGNVGQERINWINAFLNQPEVMEPITGPELLYSVIIDKKGSHTIWNKIYDAQICKKAFQVMIDGHFPRGQDLYEFIVLCGEAKRIIFIKDKIYYYRYGIGISNYDVSKSNLLLYFKIIEILIPIQEYCRENGITYIYDSIDKDIYNICISKLIQITNNDAFASVINYLFNHIEITKFLEYIINIYFYRWSELAAKIGRIPQRYEWKKIKKSRYFLP